MLLILTLNFFLTYVFVLQGKVSVADMISFSPSEVASSKYDGNLLSNKHTTLMSLVNAFFFCQKGLSLQSNKRTYSFSAGTLKSWENSITLVNIIRNEIRDGQLSFRGKRVLEVTPARKLTYLPCYFI